MKQVCFINGVHRSGTSTTAAMLHYMGYDLGLAQVRSSRKDNARGYYENLDLVRFNDRMLTARGLRWDTLCLDKAVFSAGFSDRFSEAEALLRKNFAGSERAFLKDPRLAFSVEFWSAAMRAVFPDVEEKHVLVLRDPRDVVGSLDRRTAKKVVPFAYSGAAEPSYLFWIFNILRILQQIAGRDVLRVFYADQNGPEGQAQIFAALAEHLQTTLGADVPGVFAREFFSSAHRKGAGAEDEARAPSCQAEADAVALYLMLSDADRPLSEILATPLASGYAAQMRAVSAVAVTEFLPQIASYLVHKPQIAKYLALNRSADIIWGRTTSDELARILAEQAG